MKKSLWQRAELSASHRAKRGTAEWEAAYQDFINGKTRKMATNAAIFATYWTKGAKHLPIWEELYRSYIERQLLIETAQRIVADLNLVSMEGVHARQ